MSDLEHSYRVQSIELANEFHPLCGRSVRNLERRKRSAVTYNLSLLTCRMEPGQAWVDIIITSDLLELQNLTRFGLFRFRQGRPIKTSGLLMAYTAAVSSPQTWPQDSFATSSPAAKPGKMVDLS